jgi:hypothetical protein
MAIKHTIRAKGFNKTRSVSLTPIKAIRCQCVECVGFQVAEIPKCTAPLCPLFPFRTGSAHRGKMRASKNILKAPLQKAFLRQNPCDHVQGNG